jgi:hypothetical protein
MRGSTPSARDRTLIRQLEAIGVKDVTAPRLERWRAWHGGVGLIPRASDRWREFAIGRTVPEEEVERVTAVASLCRHRRSLDEVAVRLALTQHAVAPEALDEVRKARPDLWERLSREFAPPLVEGEPLDPRLVLLPSGHVRAFYVPRDEPSRPSYSDLAVRHVLADGGPTKLLIGVRGGSSARREKEQELAGECVQCGSRVFVNLPAEGLPPGTALLCDVCAAKG